jgi:hypothetical protein
MSMDTPHIPEVSRVDESAHPQPSASSPTPDAEPVKDTPGVDKRGVAVANDDEETRGEAPRALESESAVETDAASDENVDDRDDGDNDADDDDEEEAEEAEVDEVDVEYMEDGEEGEEDEA